MSRSISEEKSAKARGSVKGRQSVSFVAKLAFKTRFLDGPVYIGSTCHEDGHLWAWARVLLQNQEKEGRSELELAWKKRKRRTNMVFLRTARNLEGISCCFAELHIVDV